MKLNDATSREDVIEVFEGLSQQSVVTDEGRVAVRRPLVKSYMLETVPPTRQRPNLVDLFRRVDHRLAAINDDRMFKVVSNKTLDAVGVVEQLLDRHPVYYTQEPSKDSDNLVLKLVQANTELDHLWISGRVFEELHQIVLKQTPKYRYGRLVFQYTSLFEHETEELIPQDEDEAGGPQDEEELDEDRPAVAQDDDYVPERRATKFSMIERLSELEKKLPKMRELHRPLWAISQLRFPAVKRGGHDFFHHGKVTNRSDSFSEHRQKVEFVLRLYSNLTSRTEQKAWSSVEKTTIKTHGKATTYIGAPVVLKFFEPLTQRVFDEFIKQTFRNENNRFRLWGDPIPLGPSKVHVYAVDRHIWQPLFLEITRTGIVVLVPNGTCGNTVHRLITNVQQYLDPAVTAVVGGMDYHKIIHENFDQIEEGSNGKKHR